MARFIGEANLIAGQLNGSSVQTLFGKLPVTHADPAVATRCPATVLIRPEQVELLPGADELDGAVAARVTGYGYHGHDAVVTVLPEAVQGPGPGGPAADRAHPGRRRAAARRAGHAARPRPRAGLAGPGTGPGRQLSRLADQGA